MQLYSNELLLMQAILQEVVEMQPVAVIIDSIQTVYLDDVNGSAGSVSQVLDELPAFCLRWHVQFRS